jgi:hypothetical protein
MINLLDGLRDLKAPLGSGLIFLFALWLIFANDIAAVNPSPTILGNIRHLTDFVGTPAALGILAFLAYLSGLLLSPHTAAFWLTEVVTRGLLKITLFSAFPDIDRRWAWKIASLKRKANSALHKFRSTRSPQLDKRLRFFIMQFIKSLVDEGKSMRDLHRQIIAVDHPKRLSKEEKLRPPTGLHELLVQLIRPSDEIAERVSLNILSEVELLAVQLHGAKEKIYDKYDKNKTESDFRAALVIPLVFVGLVAIVRFWTESLPLHVVITILLLPVVSARLMASAMHRLREANAVLLDSLIVGDIESTTMLRIRSGGQDVVSFNPASDLDSTEYYNSAPPEYNI